MVAALVVALCGGFDGDFGGGFDSIDDNCDYDYDYYYIGVNNEEMLVVNAMIMLIMMVLATIFVM
jgi:hypothetical protein